MIYKIFFRYLSYFSCCFILALPNARGQEYGFPQRLVRESNIYEYYYALGEATKLYLFGNFPQAVNLYNECIRANPQSAVSHYQLAKIYMLAGEIKLAVSNAKIASELDPDNKWYLQELARLYQANQQYDSAIFVYQLQLNREPENIAIIYMIASLYEQTGKYEESLIWLNKIDKKIGISRETSVSRYRIFESMKMDQKALEQLRNALSLSEGEYSLTGMMAEYYRSHGRPDSAFYYYRKIYPEFKDDAAVSFSYSEFLLEQKLYREAQVVLSEALTSEGIDNMTKTGYIYKIIQDEELFKLAQPVLDSAVTAFYEKYYNDLRSISVYTDIELRLRNYKKASDGLKRIIAMDKKNYAAFEQLIFSENAIGNSDSVKKYSDLAIVFSPAKPIPYLFAGSAEYQLGKYEAAVARLEEGLQLSDRDDLRLEFYSLLAECNERLKYYDKSEEYFGKALLIDKENLAIRNNYAYYLALREKNLQFAKELSKNTIEAEPANSTYLDTYGYILYRMGKLKEARKYISRALNSGGGSNAEILMHYGDILHAMSRQKEAVEIWTRALDYADIELKIELESKIQGTDIIESK